MISKIPINLASVCVFLSPLVLLSIPFINGFLYILVVGAGLYSYVKHYKSWDFTREEKLFFLSCIVLFLVALLNSDAQSSKLLTKLVYLPLTIPIYLLFSRSKVNLGYFWYGLAFGAVIAGILSIYETWTHVNAHRVKGLTHSIIFGNLALTMAILAFAGSGWFKTRSKWQVLIPIVALFAGTLASLLAQARNAWIALPILIFVTLRYTTDRITSQIVAIVFGLLLVAVFLAPGTHVKYTIDKTITNIELYLDSDLNDDIRAASLPGRFEMWLAAANIFTENPISGVGWGYYKPHARTLVEQGTRHPIVAQHSNPHSQYLSAMVNGGVIALIALAVLFIIPTRIVYGELISTSSDTIRQLALAGLLLLVAYSLFALSESILERSRPVLFFSFYLAVIFGLIKSQNQKKKQSPVRIQSLSVIIITKNEEDRIEDCLGSVANWADEIVVLDSGSNDQTVQICQRYSSKVFETDWPGYGKQKQRALNKAKSDWVLSIDSDERVSPELRIEIDTKLNDSPNCVAYRLPWSTYFAGKRLDFGRTARAPLRLFKREGARFSSDIVHEKIRPVKGSIGLLRGHLIHYAYRDYKHMLEKSVLYAYLGALRYQKRRKRIYGPFVAILRSLITFLQIYIFRMGFMDGNIGLIVAIKYAQTNYNKYISLWLLQMDHSTNKSRASELSVQQQRNQV